MQGLDVHPTEPALESAADGATIAGDNGGLLNASRSGAPGSVAQASLSIEEAATEISGEYEEVDVSFTPAPTGTEVSPGRSGFGSPEPNADAGRTPPVARTLANAGQHVLPGTEAPTPPDTPVSRSVASGADAPTPPETPALRRELLDSLKERQFSVDSAAAPSTLPSGTPTSAVDAQRPAPPAPPVRSVPSPSPSAEDIDVTVEPHDVLDSIPEEELTEVEAISEREPDGVQQKRRRLPPRPPPRTTFTGDTDEGKRRQWWEELWSDDFLRAELEPTAQEVHDEADFIEHSLAVESGGVILDLACGSGAYSVEIARRGYAVVGYDLSASQLGRAGELAQRNDQKVSFLQGDVREMAFEQMFDGAFCWNASFGFFEEEKNQAVLANVHRALKPGGSFLLDVPNRDFVVRQQPMQNWFEGDGCVCMDDMHVDFITSRLSVKRTVMLDDGRNREWFYSLRLYALHELGRMLHEVGFRVAQVSGQPATVGGFLGCYSPRMMVLAVKPTN